MLCFTIQQSMSMQIYQRPTERLLYCWATCSKAWRRKRTSFFHKAWVEGDPLKLMKQMTNKLYTSFWRANISPKKSSNACSKETQATKKWTKALESQAVRPTSTFMSWRTRMSLVSTNVMPSFTPQVKNSNRQNLTITMIRFLQWVLTHHPSQKIRIVWPR